MKVNGIPTRTIRALDNGSAIEIIDQTLLPYRFEKRILSDWRDGVEAIETMRVRGAPDRKSTRSADWDRRRLVSRSGR